MKISDVAFVAPVLAGALLAMTGLVQGCAPRQAMLPDTAVIAVTDQGFEPAVVVVPRGKPVTLIVTRRTDRTCATEMVFGTPERRYDLPLEQPVRIELTEGVTDTLRYACGMDMYRGMIVAK